MVDRIVSNWSVAQVARALGCSPSKIREMCDTGLLPHDRVGVKRSIPVRVLVEHFPATFGHLAEQLPPKKSAS